MARVSARRRPERERILVPSRQDCPGCGGHMRLRYENRRDVVTEPPRVRRRLVSLSQAASAISCWAAW
jgi:hypothetical protein